jgi:2-oxoglutarate ferredoxin oxidoreductase subunit beta
MNLSRRDFETNQEVRWCPGCGDFAILSQVQKLLPTLGIPRENFAVVSGIGCSSRFPYYVDTYGMHGIHGRAPAIATGLKLARPELSVWVITGDGDALAIGGNHFIHLMRRNVDLKILLFNNRIYGLTKGQYSPTSEFGQKSKTTPHGSIDRPLNPVSLALACGAGFVARSVDADQEHLAGVLRQAAQHRGTALVEIYQNCVTFNDGAFDRLTDRETRDENRLLLEHGKPLVFGQGRARGIRFSGAEPEVVTVGECGLSEGDCAVHDAHAARSGMAFLLSQLGPPGFPVPLGVFRAVETPTYDELNEELGRRARERSGPGRLAELLASGTTWTIG